MAAQDFNVPGSLGQTADKLNLFDQGGDQFTRDQHYQNEEAEIEHLKQERGENVEEDEEHFKRRKELENQKR